jgi:CrcB protein
MVKEIIIVGMGGFIGANARFGVCRLVYRYYKGPAGTFAVNIVGCLIIGGFMCFLESRQFSSANIRLFWIVGLLGAFTTFSAFGHETFELLRVGNFVSAFWNVGANIFLGLGAVIAGRAIIKALVM